MDAWAPKDRRQAETHRLLGLIGGAPASYFLDACRMMDGDLRLGATTHLVGHLLRELDSTLRAVLRPMVDAADWPARGTDGAHRKIVKLLCDALGVPDDDPLREAWYSLGLHRQAHRGGVAAPRPVDAEFEEFWDQAQAVIYDVARRIEANFTAALGAIDKLAAGYPDFKALRQTVPHSVVALNRFFDRAGLNWLEPLRDAGYFEEPTPLVENEDGSISAARWPQGRYIVRMAPEAPEAVLTLGMGLETDNPEAQESFVAAALVVDPAIAAGLVNDVLRWLQTRPTWGLPFRVRDLVVHLIDGGEVAAGIRLMDALLSAASGERDDHLVGELASQLTSRVFPTAGIAGLEALIARLAELVEAESYSGEDHSYTWRPRLDTERRRDPRDQLVSAVREAAQTLIAHDQSSLAEVLDAIESKGFSIFRRLALDLLAQNPDPGMAEPRLLDKEMFEGGAYRREYATLSEKTFAQISSEGQATILAWIDEVAGRDGNELDRRARQKRMLERLGTIPPEWQSRYDDMAGDPEPEVEVLPESGFVGPRSPASDAELATMPVDELVEYLERWEPDGDWAAPSPEGLARTLRQVIAADPERYAAAAMAFERLDPTYVHALFGGLREALQQDRTFPWAAALELAETILDRPRVLEGRDPRGMEHDPGWAWSWQESLGLITGGLLGDAGKIDPEHRERVWKVISALAEDPDPTPEREASSESNPETLALNCIRGSAIRAVCCFAWWLKQDGAGSLAPKVAQTLQHHLDPAHDPSTAVRSVYGQYFPHLEACDHEWAAAHVEAIFPLDGDPLGRAAWNAYLRLSRAYKDPFDLLIAQYRDGVERLGQESGEDNLLGSPDEALVHHLMGLYVMGVIDFGDEGGLLDRFYEAAPVALRAEAMDSIGQGIADEETVDETFGARVRHLFERRIDAVRKGADPAEVRGFAWWFRSRALNLDWLLSQLRAVLEAGGGVHPDHVVAERLAELATDRPLDAVANLGLLIDSPDTRNWFAIGARDSITTIINGSIANGGDAESQARDIINRLVARGFTDFEDLLPG